MIRIITWKAKERPKDALPAKSKERRKLIPFMVGSYFTHSPYNVANMQVVRSNNNRRSRSNIFCQCNLALYNKG